MGFIYWKSIDYVKKTLGILFFGMLTTSLSFGQSAEAISSNNLSEEEKKNLQIVQEIYGHIGQGNVIAVFEMLKEDAQYIIPGNPDIPYSGTFNGKQEIGGFYKTLSETLQYTRFDITSFNMVNDKVFVQGNFAGSVKPTGKPMKTDWFMVWTLEDGKVNEHQTFLDTNNIAKALQE